MPNLYAAQANCIALRQSLLPNLTWGFRSSPSAFPLGRRGPPLSKLRKGLNELQGGASHSHPIFPFTKYSSIHPSKASAPQRMSTGSNICNPAAIKALVNLADPANTSNPGATTDPMLYFCNHLGKILGGGMGLKREGWSAGFEDVSTQINPIAMSAKTRKGIVLLKIPFSLKEEDLPLAIAPTTTLLSLRAIWILPWLFGSLARSQISFRSARASWRLIWAVCLKW